MRRKKFAVYVTGCAFLWASILPCSLWSTPGKKTQKEEWTSQIPGVDANGNLTSEGGLSGEMNYSASLNTKTGRLRIKGKGTTTNLSETRQTYRNDPSLFVFVLLLLGLHFSLDEDFLELVIKGLVLNVSPQGNAKLRGSGQL